MNQDQDKLLQDAKKAAKEQAYFMRKALDNADLKNGLKFASHMLAELKTSSLIPRNYYILFMAVFDYMRELQNYFKDDFRRGRKMVDVYQAVQHAPNIIPRIYLLITAGSVYIQSHEPGADKILEDIIQMMKAVQNPLRGLFLRYYFLKMCKDRLPDTNSEYEAEGYGVEKAFEVIYTNLTQSTHLWMRIGTAKDKTKRIKQRNDLKMLIGQNLMRISSLEGVNIKVYKEIVLPKLLKLIVICKDAAAQQYLLDCMIQGFAEEFHIHTLPQLLGTCSKQLEKQVDMKSIFIALMDRLSNYLITSGNIIENIEGEINIYEMFKINIQQLVKKSDDNQVKSTLNLYSAFLLFTIRCYPMKHEYVNETLKSSYSYCSRNQSNIDDDCQIYISKFLISPLQTMAGYILTMNQYPSLMKYLKFKRKRQVAKQIAKAVVRGGIDLTQDKIVQQLLVFIQPLLKKQSDYQQISETLFKDQQIQVAKMVFQIQSQDPTVVWDILKIFIDKFLEGGQERMKYTIPSSIFRLLQLANQIRASSQTPEPKMFKKLFQLTQNLIERISSFQPVQAIKMYLQFIAFINVVDPQKYFDQFTYNLAVQCLTVYETQINQSKTKQLLLGLIINTCMRLICLSEENYDTIVSNIISYCSKIMKKHEQCAILLSCCFLFINPQADVNRIHQILKRCAKLANTSVNQSIAHVGLFLDILQYYNFFVRQKGIIQDKDDAITQITEVFQAKVAQQAGTPEIKEAIQKAKGRWVELEKHLHA